MNRVLPGDDAVIGLLGEYARADALVRAAETLTVRGYRRVEACSPIHVEGLDEALGQRPSRLGLWILGAGTLGAAIGFLGQAYACAISYPYNVGGRPLFSWPAFLAITFECGVLLASITALVAMLGFSGLPSLYHPLFNVEAFARASRDRYFLFVGAEDPHYDAVATRHLLLSTHPLEVHEVRP